MSGSDHREEWRRLRAEGMTFSEIGKRYGYDRTYVSRVVGKPPIAARSILVERPWWSVPGPDLLRVAHEARDEIRANWR